MEEFFKQFDSKNLGELGELKDEFDKLNKVLGKLKNSLKDLNVSTSKMNSILDDMKNKFVATASINAKFTRETFKNWEKLVLDSKKLTVGEKTKTLYALKQQQKEFEREQNKSGIKKLLEIVKNVNITQGVSKSISTYRGLFSASDPSSYFLGLINFSSNVLKSLGSILMNISQVFSKFATFFSSFIKVISNLSKSLGPIVSGLVRVFGSLLSGMTNFLSNFMNSLGKSLQFLGEVGGQILSYAISVLMNLAKFRNEISEKLMNLAKLLDPTKNGLALAYKRMFTQVFVSGFKRVAPSSGVGMMLSEMNILDISKRYLEAGFTLDFLKKMKQGIGIFEVAKRAYGEAIGNFEELMLQIVNFSSESIDKIAKTVYKSMQFISSSVPTGLARKKMMEAWGSIISEAFQYGVDTISVTLLQDKIMRLNEELKTVGVDLNKSIKTILGELISTFKKWGDGLKAYMSHLVFGERTQNVFASMVQYEYGPNAMIVKTPDGKRKVINMLTGENLMAGENKDLLQIRLGGIVKHLESVLSGIQGENERFYAAINYLTKSLGFSVETAKAIYFAGPDLANLSDAAKNEVKFINEDIKKINIRLFSEAERNTKISEMMLKIQVSAFQVMTSLLTMILLAVDGIYSFISKKGLFGFTDEERRGLAVLNNLIMRKNFMNIFNLTKDLVSITGLKDAAESLESITLLSKLFSGAESLPQGEGRVLEAIGELYNQKTFIERNQLLRKEKKSGLSDIDEYILRGLLYRGNRAVEENTKAINELINVLKSQMNQQFYGGRRGSQSDFRVNANPLNKAKYIEGAINETSNKIP